DERRATSSASARHPASLPPRRSPDLDDVRGDLGEAVDVRLAGAEVAALDRVVEEAEDAVAVVLVVLGRVDAALGRDGVRPPRAASGRAHVWSPVKGKPRIPSST